MKTRFFYFAIIITMFGVAGCKKSSTHDKTSSQLTQTESQLKLDFQQARNYNNILIEQHKTPGMTMSDSVCKMNDSLFHINDTAFTIHMQQYCNKMMSEMGMGSNGMMGGGSSGGMMCNMDSMMENHIMNCPEMGTLNANVQDYLDNMQAMRKVHMTFHK